ncbi:MAG TPA: RNA polymerase sigma factor [Candidatus Angelobacter sp.]|nr:RNA polymerase sigma factor [Candidatus Angelobacter sp.]
MEEGTASREEFEAVYARWVGPIYRFCLSQLRVPMLAEDVTAEVFASALASFQRVRPDEGVGTWLFRIARNAVVDEHRRRRRRVRLLDALVHDRQPDADPMVSVALRDEVSRAGGHIARLRPRDRELVGLRVAGQLSYAEIAEVVGINETAAKVATHRALKVVRAALQEEEQR